MATDHMICRPINNRGIRLAWPVREAKMGFRLAFVLIAGLIQLVMGTDFYITQPWAETVWEAGKTVKISWKVYENVGPEASGINVDLMDGDDMSANFLLNIANNLGPQESCFDWTIPKFVSSSDKVFIRITGLGEVPNYRFSHRFKIVGGEGPGVTVVAMPPSSTIDVSALVGQLPTARRSGFPAVVSLIDPNMVQTDSVTTTTISITGGQANRDRLDSGASALHSSVIGLGLLLAAVLFW